MKKILFFGMISFLAACNNKQEESNEIIETVTDSTVAVPAQGIYDPETALYVWKSSPDYTKEKNPALKSNVLNVDSLILGLNKMNENVFMEKLKLSGDTIYTEIKDSKYLAEQMGSTGAEMYLADVVLNLTEVPGVKYVNIQLQEGSHMQPGTWTKDNFAKYKPVN